VTRLLRMTTAPRPADAADALALAICHLWRAPALKARQPTASAGPALPGPVTAGTANAGPVVGGTR
jgi:crossover junction endodeoxyribonuclease RuvC